ncbi:GNAT family N-acetyltransferase [Cyclobacteriaceae bacterium YHN15]|nr:GNAT family N-acetyltransferase [Cyclobacteriaceae bacterium YHN15]
MEIRPYHNGDETAILELFNASFGRPLNKTFWDWRYKQNPFIEDTLAHLMWDGKNLVGHYAVCPIEMIIDNQPSLTALSMTTMTHPKYAGKGIFKILAESLYQEMEKNDGISMVWGFPNLNSHYGFIKNLSWNDISTIPTLKLDKGNFGLYPLTKFIQHRTFDLGKSEKIKSNVSGSVFVNKSEDYLIWRYLKNPTNTYQIISSENYPEQFVVIKIFNSFETPGYQEVDILEHGYDNDNEVFHLLIGSILAYCQHNDINLKCINTWLNIADKRHLMFERNRFSFDSPITILGQRKLNPLLSDMVFDYKNWSITMGDSDVY